MHPAAGGTGGFIIFRPMKLLNVDNVVESSGIVESGDFSIKTNPAAFQLLSSGLYSNKIRAVIRELSCNAVDAHAMNGKQGVPIEVKLPNELDTQFYVKDFGPGMSHDQVMRLYTTYFDSTKRDSNDFIGGFGVGSKSPFAYTDSFTVESRQDGKVRTYAAYVDEGFPKIAVLTEQDTDEPSGLTVRFPVKPADFDRFVSEAMEVFKWFREKPSVLGSVHPIPEMSYLKLSDAVYIPDYKKGVTSSMEACVRMGDVVYPLSKFFSQLDHQDPDRTALEWIKSRRVLLNAPIGSVSVAASREDLAYDKPTLKNIRELLTEGYRLALAEALDRVCTLDPTNWDDRREGYQLLHATGLATLWTEKQVADNAALRVPNYVPLLNRAISERNLSPDDFLPFLYASQPLDWSVFKTLRVLGARSYQKVHQWDAMRGKNNNTTGASAKMPEPSGNALVFVDDVPAKSTWATKAWKTWASKHLKANAFAFVITPLDGQADTPEFEAEKAEVMKQLGFTQETPPLSSGLAANDLETMRGRAEKSVIATTYFSARPTRIYEGKPFYWMLDDRYRPSEFSKGLSAERKSAYESFKNLVLPVGKGSDTSNDGIKAFFQLMGVPTTRLYRITPSDLELVKSMKGAKSAFDICLDALQKPETLTKIGALEKQVDIGDNATTNNPIAAMLYSGTWGPGLRVKEAVQGTQLGELVEKLRALKVKPNESSQTKVMQLINMLNDFAGKPVEVPQRIIKVDSDAIFNQTYPMLPGFARYAKEKDVAHMREYIKWCEERMAKDAIVPTTLGLF